MKNLPNKIYLQVGEMTADEVREADFNELSEVTWCKEKVSPTDIEFVRSDSNARIPEEYQRIKSLLINLLGSIANAVNGIEVGDSDCGEVHIPTFRYEPSFELTDEDIKTIKELADECEDAAIVLMDWIGMAGKEDNA